MGLQSLDEPNMFFAKLYPSSPLSNNTLKTNHSLIQKLSNNLQKLYSIFLTQVNKSYTNNYYS